MTKEEYLDIGMTAALRGMNDKAIAAFESALREDPEYVPALNQIGLAFFRAERWVAAEKTYDRLLDLSPYQVNYHAQYGLALMHQDRKEDAHMAFKRALTLDAKHPKALGGLARVAYIMGNPEEAFENGSAAVEIDSRGFATQYYLGLAARDIKREDVAARAFKAAASAASDYISVRPEHPEGYFLLGEVANAQHDTNVAAENYEKATARIRGQDSFTLYGIRFTRLEALSRAVEMYILLGDIRNAKRFAEEARLLYPDSDAVAELLAQLADK